MGDPYEQVKGGRLTFKGGILASRSKSIDKKRSKKNKSKDKHNKLPEEAEAATATAGGGHEEGSAEAKAPGGGEIYTIDAAKRLKYDQLFPVEAKKFGYDPKSNFRSVEDALDDRVQKKADRYCK